MTFLAGMNLDGRCRGFITQINVAYSYVNERSFLRRYCTMDAKFFKPGMGVDYVFNIAIETYFASIFFDTRDKRTEYRLVRLPFRCVSPLDEHTLDTVHRNTDTNDELIDDGVIEWNNEDPMLIFGRVQERLRRQISTL